MRVRWKVKVHKYTRWDDREDKFVEYAYKDEPILQYFVDGKWKDVPTVEVVVK